MAKRLDYYYHKAKDNGYLARSVFKLEEIDNKYHLFTKQKEPFFVLDLGCSPGSWLQYTITKLKNEDKVIGIDISKTVIKNDFLHFINKPIEEVSNEEILKITNNQKINLLLSDMAPKTSGIKILDQENSLELCNIAFNKAKDILKSSGTMVLKIFEGPGVKDFIKEIEKIFKDVKKFKPDSSRKNSYEIFIIAKGFLANN